MPTATINPTQRIDPTPGFGFAVEMGGQIAGWFTECSGLTVEREVKAHPEGGVNEFVHQLPGRVKRTSLTLKHGLAGNELWDWFQKGAYDGKVERRNISIVFYSSDLTELKRWDLIDVYPAKWNGATLDSAKNETVVETLEFAHTGSSGESGAAVQRTAVNSSNTGQPASPAQPAVDIPRLAKRVYELLKQDVQIERERSGRR